MRAVEIRPDVYWIGVNDRTTDLFENLWPIAEEGVAYNAYFIRDKKKVIIDSAKALKMSEFLEQIESVVDITQIDYLVINHMEPDHSGVLGTLKRIAPQMTLVTTEKGKAELDAFYGITENVRVVQDGETISLGKRTLRFISTPMVHWPETMMTYEPSDGLLFSGDAFGGFGAHRGGIFDDECGDIDRYIRETLRYFTNIVARFSPMVLKAIDKLADTPIEIVAPSHGLIWRKDPRRIVDLYRQWAGYATGKAERAITLVYGSMYGNTETMAEAVARGITHTCVPLEIFDAAKTHVSHVLPSLWTRLGVVIGAPTYETGLFHPIAHLLTIAVSKGVKNRKALRFGSYGWAGGAQREFERIIDHAHWDLVDSFEFMGRPSREDLRRGEEEGERFAKLIENAQETSSCDGEGGP